MLEIIQQFSRINIQTSPMTIRSDSMVSAFHMHPAACGRGLSDIDRLRVYLFE